MKKLSSKMKVVLILAICAAFILPSVALAGEVSNPLVTNLKLKRGKYKLPGDIPVEFAKSSASMMLNEKTTKVEFVVDNGDLKGKDRVSSVKIDLLDKKGKKRAVAISPAQFNQNMEFSNVVGTLFADDLKDLTELNLDIKVGGPKGGYLVLNVTEYYENDGPQCPPQFPLCQ